MSHINPDVFIDSSKFIHRIAFTGEAEVTLCGLRLPIRFWRCTPPASPANRQQCSWCFEGKEPWA